MIRDCLVMLYNVYNYSNQIMGQVEADDAIEAWDEAGKRFSSILDVRITETVSRAEYPPRKGVLPRLPEEAKGDILFYEYIRDLSKYEALSDEDAQRLWEGYRKQHSPIINSSNEQAKLRPSDDILLTMLKGGMIA